MNKWTTLDKDSGLTFSIEVQESGRLSLGCMYNNIKVDPRNYEFGESALRALSLLIYDVLHDIKPKKVAKKKRKK